MIAVSQKLLAGSLLSTALVGSGRKMMADSSWEPSA
jgi:hypothetical protein